MSFVKLEAIGKKYPGSEEYSVENFNIDIQEGEFIVFVGPSGCGKSTTLRMIAGLEDITEGTLSIDDNVVNEVHPKDRDIAMVFQNYALYPHMTVRKNITFGLKMQKVADDVIEEKLAWASNILGLDAYLDRKPMDLSGGQRQRVALGRAIVRNPKVFLMDEPLSNLDAKLRVVMRNEISKLHRQLQSTTIYVTHDQVEAMTMADRIVVMKDGIVQQIGQPMHLYNNPANIFVATFLGAPKMNIFEVDVEGEYMVLDNRRMKIPSGIFKNNDLKDGKYFIGIRPEHLSLDSNVANLFEDAKLSISVQNIERMGSENYIYSKLRTFDFVMKIPARVELKIDDVMECYIDMNKIHFFDINTKENLQK